MLRVVYAPFNLLIASLVTMLGSLADVELTWLQVCFPSLVVRQEATSRLSEDDRAATGLSKLQVNMAMEEQLHPRSGAS